MYFFFKKKGARAQVCACDGRHSLVPQAADAQVPRQQAQSLQPGQIACSIFTTRSDYVFYFYNQVRLRVLFLQPGQITRSIFTTRLDYVFSNL